MFWKNSLNNSGRFLAAGLAPLLVTIAVFFSWGAPPTRAAEGSCTFEAEMEKLESAKKDGGLSYFEVQEVELKIRKELFQKIISCGISEVGDLKQAVAEITSENSDVVRIKSRVLGELNEALNYYQIQRGGISDLGIFESKKLAQSILDWRVNSYKYFSGRTLNFVVWARNQELLSSAELRLAQAGRLINAFRLNNNKEIVGIFQKAFTSFADAKATNTKVRGSLEGYPQPGELAKLIKSSLESLVIVYQNLFEFNDAFKKILPKL